MSDSLVNVLPSSNYLVKYQKYAIFRQYFSVAVATVTYAEYTKLLFRIIVDRVCFTRVSAVLQLPMAPVKRDRLISDLTDHVTLG